ncbi:MAG TPA: carboxypeptidase-like regulatory domain-containing protein, partial [Nitrososphaera sp.]|nr:carboxypeptidase-like regulatory domain-containing protein [Nitrososphaera sp.]
MSRRFSVNAFGSLAAVLVTLCVLNVLPAWAQHGSEGSISVIVRDTSGSVVQDAQLELRDLATNATQTAGTQDAGTYRFVNLPLGNYKLSVSKAGFKTAIFDPVIVQATKTTDISATLAVGTVSEVVVVNDSGAPLVETSSSAISTVIDLKQIENLPIQGRDLAQLNRLVPGYTGTWDGLPSIAQGSNIDGVIGSSSRMKFGGNAAPSVSPRLEDIQEMTVQTNQLDLNQGYGQANMQTNFVTRRGGSTFHGRVFEDHRDASLNANSWHNDAVNFLNPNSPQIRKTPFILNDFGGSLGGPIIKDKLFFFGTFAMSKQPGSTDAKAWVMTPAAQQGVFTYNNTQTVNVLQLAGNGGFPSTVISQTATALAAAQKALQFASVVPSGDPNFVQLNWQVAAPTTIYYPTVRVDYNHSEKLRFNVAFNETKTSQPGANPPNLPGPDFAKTGAGNQFKAYTAAFGNDWTISSTLVNEFRGGFLYTYNGFAFNAPALDAKNPQISWNLPNLPDNTYNTAMNGTNFQIPTGSYYPLFNASDTLTWQHKAHTMNFGISWWREQDHY